MFLNIIKINYCKMEKIKKKGRRIISKKKKKDVLKEILVDPVNYNYTTGDRRNSANYKEIYTNLTTDQISNIVDQPEDMFFPYGYGNFFYEDKEYTKEEILKKKDYKKLLDNKNKQVSDKIVKIIDKISDEFSDIEKFDLIKEIIKKLEINKLDGELLEELTNMLVKKEDIIYEGSVEKLKKILNFKK